MVIGDEFYAWIPRTSPGYAPTRGYIITRSFSNWSSFNTDTAGWLRLPFGTNDVAIGFSPFFVTGLRAGTARSRSLSTHKRTNNYTLKIIAPFPDFFRSPRFPDNAILRNHFYISDWSCLPHRTLGRLNKTIVDRFVNTFDPSVIL